MLTVAWDLKRASKPLNPQRLLSANFGDAPRSFPKFLGWWRTALAVAGATVYAPEPSPHPFLYFEFRSRESRGKGKGVFEVLGAFVRQRLRGAPDTVLYHFVDKLNELVYIVIHASQAAPFLPDPKAHPQRARRAAETRASAPKAHDRHRLSTRGHLTDDTFSRGSWKPRDRTRDTTADSVCPGARDRSRLSRGRR